MFLKSVFNLNTNSFLINYISYMNIYIIFIIFIIKFEGIKFSTIRKIIRINGNSKLILIYQPLFEINLKS